MRFFCPRRLASCSTRSVCCCPACPSRCPRVPRTISHRLLGRPGRQEVSVCPRRREVGPICVCPKRRAIGSSFSCPNLVATSPTKPVSPTAIQIAHIQFWVILPSANMHILNSYGNPITYDSIRKSYWLLGFNKFYFSVVGCVRTGKDGGGSQYIGEAFNLWLYGQKDGIVSNNTRGCILAYGSISSPVSFQSDRVGDGWWWRNPSSRETWFSLSCLLLFRLPFFSYRANLAIPFVLGTRIR